MSLFEYLLTNLQVLMRQKVVFLSVFNRHCFKSLLCWDVYLEEDQDPLAHAWHVAPLSGAPLVPADAGRAVVCEDALHAAKEAAEVVRVVLSEPVAAGGLGADADALPRVGGGDLAQEYA